MPLYFHESRETIEILQRVVNQLDERDGTILSMCGRTVGGRKIVRD